jgi:hypothetical protein
LRSFKISITVKLQIKLSVLMAVAREEPRPYLAIVSTPDKTPSDDVRRTTNPDNDWGARAARAFIIEGIIPENKGDPLIITGDELIKALSIPFAVEASWEAGATTWQWIRGEKITTEQIGVKCLKAVPWLAIISKVAIGKSSGLGVKLKW